MLSMQRPSPCRGAGVLAGPKAAKALSPVVLLEQLKGIGREIASVLYLEYEGFWCQPL
jgi:hypothetical protein